MKFTLKPKSRVPKSVTETGVVKLPTVLITRAPVYAQSPVVSQHPSASNSVAASVRPFGKPLA